MVLVYLEVGGRAGILVFRFLGQGPHEPAAGTVHHRVGAGDDEPLGDSGGRRRDLFCVPKHPHGLAAVYGGALHFRLPLEQRQLRAVGRVDGVAAHMVQALAAYLRALHVAPAPLAVAAVEPPRPGVPVHPAVKAPLVEHLPGLWLNGLAGIHAPDLNALPEPADDAVGPGGVEDIWELIGSLALQVIQVPLARHDFEGAAHLPQLPLGHLLGVDAHRMVQPGFPSFPHVNPQKDRRPAPPPRPGPVSGQTEHGQRASAPACRRTGEYSVPAPGASQ